MFRRRSARFTSIGIYLLLLFSCTLVILGMIVNLHNRDCSEQVILKTYALIKSMSNGNPYDQQKILSQLIQDDEILLQHSRNGNRDLPNFPDKSRERIARHGIENRINRIENSPNIKDRSRNNDRLPPKINALVQKNVIGNGLQDPPPKREEEIEKLDGGLRQPPPKIEKKPKFNGGLREPPPNIEKNPKFNIDLRELPPNKPAHTKLDLSDGLRKFERDPKDYHNREIKYIPPMETVKENLRKALAKHINPNEITRIRNSLIANRLTFERTVTSKILDENEEETEIRRQEFLSKINAPYESCALVGNGGVLEESYCGAEIDAHDFVMRSNMAPITGYEEDVGEKVNFMTLNGEGTKTLIKCVKTFNRSCQRIYETMTIMDKSILWFSKYGTLNRKFTRLIGRYLNSTVTHPSEPLSEELMKFWDITEHPSSGLFLYSIAAPLCKSISLYGFYPYSTLPDGKRIRYHYYENFYIEDFDMGHDLPREFKLLKKLNRTGALRLRAKPCF